MYMRFPTKLAVSGTVALSLLMPIVSSAKPITSSQLNKIEDLLESYGVASTTIHKVTRVLVADTASSTPISVPPGQFAKQACITLMRDIGPGAQGEDVKKLQELLREDSEIGFTASSTGYFGPLTMRAMMKYQMKHGIASSTDGRVGPLTRGFFNRRCGLGLDNLNSGPGSINSGRGSWKNGTSTDDDDDDDSDEDEDEDEDDDSDDSDDDEEDDEDESDDD